MRTTQGYDPRLWHDWHNRKCKGPFRVLEAHFESKALAHYSGYRRPL